MTAEGEVEDVKPKLNLTIMYNETCEFFAIYNAYY